MSLRSFLKRALVWFGPTVIFLVVAEVAARSFNAGAPNPLQSDSVLNHVWIPNEVRTTSSFVDRGIPPFTRRVNGQSWMMDYDVAPDKKEGTYRIAYLGDSFTEGTCPEQDTVPSIVGRNLRVPGFSGVEVINTGTSSYAPTLYYLLLKTRLLGFHPDLIVLNVDMTDVFDDSLYRATLTTDQNGEPIACPPGHPLLGTHQRTERGLEEIPMAQRGVAWLSERSALIKLLAQVSGQFKRRAKVDDGGVEQAFAWCGANRSDETKEDVRWSMSMLKRVIQLAKRHGIKVVVTGVPHLQQLDGRWSLQPMNDIAAVCAEEGVPFLDPIHSFKQRLGNTPPSDIYIPNDMHFNPKGYQMWAEIQLDFLKGLNLP